jgi:hypothetical protein
MYRSKNEEYLAALTEALKLENGILKTENQILKIDKNRLLLEVRSPFKPSSNQLAPRQKQSYNLRKRVEGKGQDSETDFAKAR